MKNYRLCYVILKVKPKVFTVSEGRIRKDGQPIANNSLQNYPYEHPATESSSGGALLYKEKNLT